MELTILFILFTDKEIPRMTNCPSSLTVFLEPGQSSQVSSQPHSSKKNIVFFCVNKKSFIHTISFAFGSNRFNRKYLCK